MALVMFHIAVTKDLTKVTVVHALRTSYPSEPRR